MFARLICSWIVAFGLASGAFAQTYVQFSVGSIPSPVSINEKGEIAGFYFESSIREHGFVRDPGGTITTFDVPESSGTGTFVSSINDEGVVTGSFSDALGLSHGYIRDPEGNFTTFDPPGSVSTLPGSIKCGRSRHRLLHVE